MERKEPKWLKNAVFYEIYPQSFCDSNGDGIGDFDGIISKLDYIKSLGVNALWINPCYDSPFEDAGYDVRDYKKVAPRYGTNEDLYRLFDEAHALGIHVLLDLVPGHTSDQHAWFRESCRQERNEYSDRYIWTNFVFEGAGGTGYPYIGGRAERGGAYVLNFFACQPALNYGWLHPDKPWQKAADSDAAIGTREAMKDVMRFWMDHGCDGFRVDMAASLVKGDDDGKSGTSQIWKNVREMFDADYPECALVSEWSEPKQALKAGFHMDFILNNQDTGYATLNRDYQNHVDRNVLSDPCFTGLESADGAAAKYEDHSFFKKDAGGDIRRFLDIYLDWYTATKDNGYISLITCNHDTVRPAFSLTERELKLFYAFLFTMPGVPFLYYGDELGMRYQSLRTKEGGYFRTGSRTPMQFTRGKNLGFSDADPDKLYLPVDPDGSEFNVEAEEERSDSLLHFARQILAIRAVQEDLQSQPNLEILYAESGKVPLVYKRGARIIAINPTSKEVSVDLSGTADREPLYVLGSGSLKGGTVTVGAQSFVLF